MAQIDSEECGGDENTFFSEFGKCFGSKYGGIVRDLADGEKTMGFVDMDGRWNGGIPSYVISNDFETIQTGTVSNKI